MERPIPLNALQEQMTKHGLNAVETAQRAGLGRDTISRWLSGARTPRLNELDQALGVFGLRLTVAPRF